MTFNEWLKGWQASVSGSGALPENWQFSQKDIDDLERIVVALKDNTRKPKGGFDLQSSYKSTCAERRHRCFRIPKDKLDLFLVALDVNFSREPKHLICEMEYVFVAPYKRYDVVVSLRGSYPYVEKQLEEFVESL